MSVSVEMLMKVWKNCQAWLNTVLEDNGGEFEPPTQLLQNSRDT